MEEESVFAVVVLDKGYFSLIWGFRISMVKAKGCVKGSATKGKGGR